MRFDENAIARMVKLYQNGRTRQEALSTELEFQREMEEMEKWLVGLMPRPPESED